MKHTKKLLCIIFSVSIIFCLCSLTAFAGDTYEIPDFDATITIPDGLYYFTKDMDADDPALEHFGLTPEDVNGLLTDEMFMAIMPSDASFEIDLLCGYNSTINVSSDAMTDDNFEAVVNNSIPKMESYFKEIYGDDFTISADSIQTYSGNLKYAVIHITATDTVTNKSYYLIRAVCFKNNYEFCLSSNSDTEIAENYMISIMDSISIEYADIDLSSIKDSSEIAKDLSVTINTDDLSMTMVTTTKSSGDSALELGIAVVIFMILAVVLVLIWIISKAVGNHKSKKPKTINSLYPTNYGNQQSNNYGASQGSGNSYGNNLSGTYPNSQQTQSMYINYNISLCDPGICEKCGSNTVLYKMTISQSNSRKEILLCNNCLMAIKNNIEEFNRKNQ